jgi:hypothetical protein
MRIAIAACLLASASTAGCRGETTASAPVVPLRNMHDQDRYDVQSESDFFADGRTMRPPVPHTVSREEIIDPALGQGRLPDDSGYVLEIPRGAVESFGSMEALLDRGSERFGIYCTPCHDGTGSGKGTVVERGLAPAPPSFHDDRLRQAPDGMLFATISNGVRNMPSYAARIPVKDRWAIVGYVRALQLSQGGQ